jgi:hypothetical protein
MAYIRKFPPARLPKGKDDTVYYSQKATGLFRFRRPLDPQAKGIPSARITLFR